MSIVYRAGDVSLVFELAKSETGAWRQGAEFLFEKGRVDVAIPSPMATDQIAQVLIEEQGVVRGSRDDDSISPETGASRIRLMRLLMTFLPAADP